MVAWGTFAIDDTINTFIATGGITTPIINVTITMIPYQTGSTPSLFMTGIRMGVIRITKAMSSRNDPPIRYTNIIMVTMSSLGRERPPSQSATAKGVLVAAKKWPRIVAPAINMSTMQAAPKESSVLSHN